MYNRSTSIKRSRLAAANRKTEPLKLKIKLPHTSSSKLKELQTTVASLLSTALGSARGIGNASGDLIIVAPAASGNIGPTPFPEAAGGFLPLVQPGSAEVQFCKFTDAGMELLVKVMSQL